MKVENHVMPGKEQIEAMANDPGPDGPIVMVNLLKFRDKAAYKDGSDADLSGREAYARYGAGVAPLIEKHGGRLIFAGPVTFLTLGLVEDMWDQVALVEYPKRASLFEMSTSDAYQEISHHRDAGLEGQLNIETTPDFILPS
ncbi:hypothetical protein BN1012_Phect1159 [Candidatus Phaeomarinobacter ectocarpi]|uniref:DUF1330 domain-containing protein n=1 Tax=Candidatus Phaeomarinibacter ectocarpi TaxID=1458461 RepID=X5M805_9HYPH|nr:DUF1330 domain-containing protein [Candidatus Phaeomarinobacter ectocarpi]CDO59373.1 hypothetical protein BN1012_Phect1159 [Candidatus Phaeomarinobacter ectocarpi]